MGIHRYLVEIELLKIEDKRNKFIIYFSIAFHPGLDFFFKINSKQ